MTNQDKARSVMARTGQPGNRCAGFSDTELDELAAIYDQCLDDESPLKQLVGEFWAGRAERLAAAKATDDTPASAFRSGVEGGQL